MSAASATKAPTPTLGTTLAAYPGTVGVFAMHLDQRGDIIGALNIRNMVKKLLPSGKTVFSYIDPTYYQGLLVMQGRKIVPVEEILDCKENEVVKLDSLTGQLEKFGTIVIYPSYHDDMLPDSIRRSGVPLLKLREPGAGPADPELVEGDAYTLGLGKDEIGVVLSEQTAALRAHFKAHKTDTPLQRLANLAALPKPLVSTILGSEFSPAAIEAFHKKGKLFYGYGNAPEITSTFVNALCSLSPNENVTVCLANQCPEDYLSLLDQKLLFKSGFSTIKIDVRTSEGNYVAKNNAKFKTTKGDRVLHVIFTPMSQGDVFTLQKAAEPKTLACSENSLFESLALGSCCAFDVRMHKHELVLELIARFEKKNRMFGPLLRMAYFGAQEPGEIVDVSMIVKGLRLLFTQMDKDPALRKDWEEVVDSIFATCDIRPRFEKLLCQKLGAVPTPAPADAKEKKG